MAGPPAGGGGGGGGFDYNAWAAANLNKKSDGGGDGTNEKGILDFVVDAAAAKGPGLLTKLTGAPDMTQLGQTSVTTGFDSEGFTGKTPPSLLTGADLQGGFLARLLHAVFIKNREITDHTQYINASGEGGSGGGGDGGGGAASSGGSDYAPISSMGGAEPQVIEFGGKLIAAGASYDGDFSFLRGESSITPPSTPSVGVSSGVGMEM